LLNEQLYKDYLRNANFCNKMFNCIQTYIDPKLMRLIETLYDKQSGSALLAM
jgi:hypothetical protein